MANGESARSRAKSASMACSCIVSPFLLLGACVKSVYQECAEENRPAGRISFPG
jgi:hypothetical protein